MYAERLLPHSIDAEEAVLGACMISGEMVAELAATLTPGDFYREKNALVWTAMLALHRTDRVVDQITVGRMLHDMSQLETVGGMAYLSHLIAITPTSVFAPTYADEVVELRRRRDGIAIGGKLAGALYDGSPSAAAFQEAMLSMLSMERKEAGRPKSGQELFDLYQDDLYQEALGEPAKHGRVKPTGYKQLDDALNGWENGLLYLIGGRPSMGKTLLLANLALRVAEQGRSVFFFTLETSERALLRRMATSLAQLDMFRHRDAGPTEREINLDCYAAALNTLSELPLWMYDRRGLRPMDIRSVLAQHEQQHGKPDLVVIDYLNQLSPNRARNGAYEDVTEIVQEIKTLGGNMEIPVIMGAQFSRALENRPDQARRPVLRDFRDSGRIEEIASVVMALYRPAYYWRTEEEWEKAFPGVRYPANLLELLVLKQQEGPTGRMFFNVNLGSGHIQEAPDAV